LCEVVASNLKSLLLGVDQLEGFVQRPVVFFHQVGCEHSAGSALTVQGMNEAAFALLHCLFYKGEDGIECIVLFVEDLNGYGRTFSSFSVQ